MYRTPALRAPDPLDEDVEAFATRTARSRARARGVVGGAALLVVAAGLGGVGLSPRLARGRVADASLEALACLDDAPLEAPRAIRARFRGRQVTYVGARRGDRDADWPLRCTAPLNRLVRRADEAAEPDVARLAELLRAELRAPDDPEQDLSVVAARFVALRDATDLAGRQSRAPRDRAKPPPPIAAHLRVAELPPWSFRPLQVSASDYAVQGDTQLGSFISSGGHAVHVWPDPRRPVVTRCREDSCEWIQHGDVVGQLLASTGDETSYPAVGLIGERFVVAWASRRGGVRIHVQDAFDAQGATGVRGHVVLDEPETGPLGGVSAVHLVSGRQSAVLVVAGATRSAVLRIDATGAARPVGSAAPP